MDPARTKAVSDFLTANQIVTRATWKARASKVDATKPENLDWEPRTKRVRPWHANGPRQPLESLVMTPSEPGGERRGDAPYPHISIGANS